MDEKYRDHFLRVLDQVDKYGVSVQGIFSPMGEDPPFAYTVGLYRLIQHEVIVIGLPPELALKLINTLHAKIKDGLVLEHGLTVEGITLLLPVMFIDVQDRRTFHMGTADLLMLDNKGQVPVFQMIWPKADGTWPEPSRQQPILGDYPPGLVPR